MKIILPWPPRALSPNSRKHNHWGGTTKIKKDYHEQCFLLAQKHEALQVGKNYKLLIEFYPPRLAGDIDNMLSSCKHGLDGVARALRINDKQFRPITIDIPAKSQVNPRVEITISQ